MLQKKEMINNIKDEAGVDFKEANKMYDIVMSCIKKGVEDEGSVKIPEVGIIKTVTRKGRENIIVPGIQEPIKSEPKQSLIIDINKKLEERLNRNREASA